ncbi:MAG: GH92 family glycosyl hydrolase [Bacteroidales bacterium]|nr:GH92 family glycosyl hydrolase [Bacteroidales bacterium]
MRNRVTSLLFVLSLFISLYSCQEEVDSIDILKYVNPIIGTDGHGHTYPGATAPFGMVQLSPDTRLEGWDGCSGYHYSDSLIYGFSHTHLSGTGVSDYADLLFMPFQGEIKFTNSEYASGFSHQNEIAKAGYYKVLLNKFNIEAELTATTRSGMHRYHFSQKSPSGLLIDLAHRDEVLDSYINIVNDSTIEGYRISRAWAQKQSFYFYIQFNQAFSQFEIQSNDSLIKSTSAQSKAIKAALVFDQLNNQTLMAKVGVSSVDIKGAKQNVINENPNWNFEETLEKTQDTWRKILSKVIIEDEEHQKEKTIFYTSLYHNYIVPNTFSDIDGRYRGMDDQIHKTASTQYTIFSLWDTYRATHPLYTILEPARVAEFIETFKNQYNEGGILPIWELSSNYTGCMIGYHSIPVIADAYLKGLTNIPVDTLLKMMTHSAFQDHLGLEAYKRKGYISIEDDAESVSKTLEYAFDDWCIAQVAKKAGRDSLYQLFTKRAQSYKNLFDSQTHCMRPKINETWKSPFDPAEVDFNFTEANSWQYSFYVPQDVKHLIEMHGGAQNFEQQLDALFNADSQTKGREQSDITGLIGQYAHGNEPSHHIAYLYNFVDRTDKTVKYVEQIKTELYNDRADGLCGNEDCGQMSAWYVFSAIGFYPVNPANGTYILGSPSFNNLHLTLDNGNIFSIEKKGEGKYISQILLNGNILKTASITHQQILDGGHLTFVYSNDDKANYKQESLPISSIDNNLILPTPSIRNTPRVFRGQTEIGIDLNKQYQTYFQVNKDDWKIYTEPIKINGNTQIKLFNRSENASSDTVVANFYQIPEGKQIDLQTHYHPQYSAGGDEALIDGITGTKNFRTGAWQGFYFDDLKAIVDLGDVQRTSKVSMNFIQDARSWIWLPPYVEFWGSTDSVYFFPLGKAINDIADTETDVTIKTFQVQFYPKAIRYIKVFAKNELYCPKWHPGAGNRAFIFSDEIVVD